MIEINDKGEIRKRKIRFKRIVNKAREKFNLPYDELTPEQQEWAVDEIDIEDETEVWD